MSATTITEQRMKNDFSFCVRVVEDVVAGGVLEERGEMNLR